MPAHASFNQPMFELSDFLWFFLVLSHWIWFPPLAVLPIALLIPGRRPITDPPSRRWPDVFACMALSYASFIPIELILVGSFVDGLDPWGPGTFIAPLLGTLFLFDVFQAGVGMLMKRRRAR